MIDNGDGRTVPPPVGLGQLRLTLTHFSHACRSDFRGEKSRGFQTESEEVPVVDSRAGEAGLRTEGAFLTFLKDVKLFSLTSSKPLVQSADEVDVACSRLLARSLVARVHRRRRASPIPMEAQRQRRLLEGRRRVALPIV